VPSFQGEEQADRDELAWVQFRLALLRDFFHLIVDKAEYMDDNVFGGYNMVSFRECFLASLLDTSVLAALNSSLN
jgi:hypothetical protein